MIGWSSVATQTWRRGLTQRVPHQKVIRDFPSQRTSFAQVPNRGRACRGQVQPRGEHLVGSWIDMAGPLHVNLLGQALAVLAQSCDKTGALKPGRRGRLCGACNRTCSLQSPGLLGRPAVGGGGLLDGLGLAACCAPVSSSSRSHISVWQWQRPPATGSGQKLQYYYCAGCPKTKLICSPGRS